MNKDRYLLPALFLYSQVKIVGVLIPVFPSCVSQVDGKGCPQHGKGSAVNGPSGHGGRVALFLYQHLP